MDLSIHERTLHEAARWHARLQATDCSDADREALRRWQQEHSSHADAYAVAASVSRHFEDSAADPRLQALADEAFASYGDVRPCQRRRWMMPAVLAASIAIATVGLRLAVDTPIGINTVAYETATGERRTIALTDGSSVEMDVGTRLAVRMSAQRRDIELLSGRALFDVAHDAGRPFSVTAAGSRTTALGTRFQVQWQDQRVVVTLAEGSVAINAAASVGSASKSWEEHLSPGEQLSIDRRTAARDKRAIDPLIATSWTQGRHVFRGTPLQDALNEVNRYADRKVRLGDPALADLQVGGNFIAGDSEQIVAAIAAVLPLRIVASGDKEIILFRRYDALK